MFSDTVCREVGNYVYRLIDPRNGQTFYIGKGKNNRVFQHASGDTGLSFDEDGLNPKYERIRAIKLAGMQVEYVIHRHNIPPEAVYHVEAALIDAYTGLTNIQGGHGSNDYGPMHPKQISDLYDLQELDTDTPEKLIFININKQFDSKDGYGSVYEMVRFAWRIQYAKARKADYVCAVVRGVIVGVFQVKEWLEANVDNFPEFSDRINSFNNQRWGFVGNDAPAAITKQLLNKRLPKGIRHVQNPVRYFNL